MNDYIIEHYLAIIETGSSEIAKINALRQLEKHPEALEAFFKQKKAIEKEKESIKQSATPQLTDVEKQLLGLN